MARRVQCLLDEVPSLSPTVEIIFPYFFLLYRGFHLSLRLPTMLAIPIHTWIVWHLQLHLWFSFLLAGFCWEHIVIIWCLLLLNWSCFFYSGPWSYADFVSCMTKQYFCICSTADNPIYILISMSLYSHKCTEQVQFCNLSFIRSYISNYPSVFPF